MTEQKILTIHAVPGMVVAEDIYTKDHNLIIAKNTALTDRIITRLKFYTIVDLLIYSDAQDTDVDFIETTYYESLRNSESFKRFHHAYQSKVDVLKDALDDIVYEKKNVDTEQLLSDVSDILINCNTSIELFDMLHNLRHYDDTTYIHSMNVALICNVIGRWLNFNPKALEIATLCGLLHDIGKMEIPSEIILKPAKLTGDEFRIIQTHSLRGYEILKNQNLDPRIKAAVLMHHERCDGSGYPYAFSADRIEPYAKLVAIADVYDAMTSARVYRGPLCPFDAIQLLESEGLTKYDPHYVMTFLEGIVQTYIHTHVILSNEQRGKIIFINRHQPSKPVVMIGDEFIDLSKRKDLFIKAMI